jgi:hypothetical protein
MPPTLTSKIIDAAIEGFEAQKRGMTDRGSALDTDGQFVGRRHVGGYCDGGPEAKDECRRARKYCRGAEEMLGSEKSRSREVSRQRGGMPRTE